MAATSVVPKVEAEEKAICAILRAIRDSRPEDEVLELIASRGGEVTEHQWERSTMYEELKLDTYGGYRDGRNAFLAAAMRYKDSDTFQLLRALQEKSQASIDFYSDEKGGMCAVQLAAHDGNVALLRVLGELGCNMEAAGHGGMTAFGPRPPRSLSDDPAVHAVLDEFTAGFPKTKAAGKS